MKNRNISIIGVFCFHDMPSGGQPVKTRELYYALQKQYGANNVTYLDTFKWRSHIISFLISLIKEISKAKVVIMLPAHNGVKVFLWLIPLLAFKGQRIYYDVIGGWLPVFAQKSEIIRKQLKRLDGIWVETVSMKESLESLGINNVNVIPNFKSIKHLSDNELDDSIQFPLKLCTFSRVVKEKGIVDAVKGVTEINNTYNRVMMTLDIYGPVAENYQVEFEKMIENAPHFIQYKGEEKPSNSVRVLRNYIALLFPTKFYTEGVPGTIIDAYAAGVPVIAPRWKNYSDVCLDGETSWLYDFNDYKSFVCILNRLVNKPETFTVMKKNALDFSKRYTPDYALSIISEILSFIN